jgi:hypothetical protein
VLACGKIASTGDLALPSEAGEGHPDGHESFESQPEPTDVARDRAAAPAPVSDASVDTIVQVGASSFRLDVHFGSHLQVVSDTTGNAVVMWEAATSRGRVVRSVFWDAVAARWMELEGFDMDEFSLRDPHGSRFPVVTWSEKVDAMPETEHRFMRRFDPEAKRWGPPVQQPDPPGYINAMQVGVDPMGNAHTFWHNVTNNWSLWRVDQPTWGPVVTFDSRYLLHVESGGTFLQQDNAAFSVRRFDSASETWSDPIDLVHPPNPSHLQMETLAIAPDGSVLGVLNRREPERLVVEARRFDPTTGTWAPTESVMSVATMSNPSILQGPVGAFTTGARSFVWIPVPTDGAESEIHVAQFDPLAHAWVPFKVFDHVLAIGDEWFQLCADQMGNVYGIDPMGLVRMGPDGIWQEAAGQHAAMVKAGVHGAFAADWDSQQRIGVMKSDGAGEWVPARGLLEGARLEIGSVPLAMVTIGENRALVVWTASYLSDEGVWASFVE